MQNIPPEDPQHQTVFNPIPSLSGSQPPLHGGNPAQSEKKQPLFYTVEDDPDLPPPLLEEQDDQAHQSTPFVLPFQNSGALPTLATTNVQGRGPAGAPPPVATPLAKKRWGSFQLLKLLLIGSVVLITVIGASLFVFAQSTTSPTTTPVSSTHTTGTTGIPLTTTANPMQATQRPRTQTPIPTRQSSAQATATSSHQGQATQPTGTSPTEMLPSTQLLNHIGWTQAGLTLGDALEALRTGSTFTDREMSYDYRTIGTSTHHSGTFTGSTFLLTPGGQVRFTHYDVRMIDNVLYSKVQTEKMIQQVVNAQPSLVQFQILQVQGQPHLFAWVNVAFELLQSKIDPGSGNRTESLAIDPATGQPLVHTMTVLLVRIPPESQGENAPMGGTGWLVNTYALDSSTLPAIATDPSL